MAAARLAHPAKVANAVRRRLFERRMAAVPLEPEPGLVHLGTEYGGWIVPEPRIPRGGTAYCVGTGTDVSFDLALVERHGCRVLALDPAEQAEAHVRQVTAGIEGYEFVRAALADRDGTLEMWVAEDPAHAALSAANLQNTSRSVQVPSRSLASLMAERGDERVDVLKVDVEGIEYDLIPTLDLRGAGVEVLLIELHHTASVATARGLIDGLAREGLRPVARDLTNFTFVRRG